MVYLCLFKFTFALLGPKINRTVSLSGWIVHISELSLLEGNIYDVIVLKGILIYRKLKII